MLFFFLFLGAYEVDKVFEFQKRQHRLKPSSAFVSKTDRLGDLRKGAISNNFIKSRLTRKLKDFEIEADEKSLSEEFEFVEVSKEFYFTYIKKTL